ncbi:hypothetical protein EDB81DRAFT_826454 [Dactylonectria macrodidyma]|uniref:F-box domain-containing protein n=1 Tax=Dactylonectria macrodidyma TaxID=307937 RepID=A0A9P9D5V2_9HYPO|nr:hypothetical protein EDB81DRAFT_826454 [Dactylonectria macrodidyma]
MVALLELPTEVVCAIAEFLPGNSLFSFRQTCQGINTKTRGIFECAYFQTRYVMFERQSLDILKAISEHPSLRHAVRTLGLCIEHLSKSEMNKLRYADCPLQVHGDEIPPYFEDSVAQHCLVQAMRKLPNCKTLVLTDAHVPWGSVRLQKEAGCVLERGLETDFLRGGFVQYLLNVMLTAAVESKLPVEKLDIYLGHMDEPNCVQPISVSLLDVPLTQDKPAPARLNLATLTSLRLILCPYPGDSKGPRWEPAFDRFLAMFPQLSHFTLAFDGEEQYDHHDIFPRLSKAISIPKLRVVEFARLEATVSELAEVLVRHRQTLEEATLRDVKLRGIGSWPFLLNILRNMFGVRRVTMKNCLIEDEWIRDHCDDMPDIVCITDQRTYANVVGWIEEATDWMLKEGHEEFSAIDPAVQNPSYLQLLLSETGGLVGQ